MVEVGLPDCVTFVYCFRDVVIATGVYVCVVVRKKDEVKVKYIPSLILHHALIRKVLPRTHAVSLKVERIGI